MSATLDLDALEAAARAATPGPWMRLFGERTVYDRMEDGCRGNAIVRADMPSRQDAANLDYIAAANPAVILEVVARLRAAEATPMHAVVQVVPQPVESNGGHCD